MATNVTFRPLDAVENEQIRFACIIARHQGRWVYCKHRERNTWENPGGRREPGEDILQTAHRELCEETGAEAYSLTPVCLYAVQRDGGDASYGLLCRADITAFSALGAFEIERIAFFDEVPEPLTYPDIQPKLLKRAREGEA